MVAAVAPLQANPPPFASLYVGDLDPSVSESNLLPLFSLYARVASIRVCRDSATGRSLRYAYVNFCHRNEAEYALRGLNHTPLHGKPMRIMWSQRDPIHRRTGIGNLFIKNLDRTVDGRKLEGLFAAYGMVISCKVVMGDDGRTKGYGFVQFSTEESAQAAIRGLHGKTPFGEKMIYVAKFIKKSERVKNPPKCESFHLYVGNIDSSISDDLLCEKFSPFGELQGVTLHRDTDLATLSFKSREAIAQAMEAMNGVQLGSKAISVAQSKEELQKSQRPRFDRQANLYVKNLDPSTDDETLRKIFGVYGEIVSARVMRDSRGESRGFGFVCFSSAEEARKAQNAMHGAATTGNRRLYVAKAQRKEERAHYLQTLFSSHFRNATSNFCGFEFQYPTGQYCCSPEIYSYYPQGPAQIPHGFCPNSMPSQYGQCWRYSGPMKVTDMQRKSEARTRILTGRSGLIPAKDKPRLDEKQGGVDLVSCNEKLWRLRVSLAKMYGKPCLDRYSLKT